MNAGDLRCKVSFYKPAYNTNELGEDIQDELELVAENVPAQIVPTSGYNRDMMGDVDATFVTHKIRIRTGAVNMEPNMVIMYEGLRYDVRYWQPVYNNKRFMEILTVLEVAV